MPSGSMMLFYDIFKFASEYPWWLAESQMQPCWGLGTNRFSEISERLAKLREYEPPWEDLLDMLWWPSPESSPQLLDVAVASC